MEKIMIIDGSSLLHRAFYALPTLSTKDGLYTNGVYGFLTMFYRIFEEYKPDYICVAFDKKGPTFRHKEFKDYKGTRQSTPSELAQQFPMIRSILKAMKIKTLAMDEYEADDIVGTLSNIAKDKSIKSILVTGDKDYLQLVDDNTKVLITRKGISEMDIYDEEKIAEDYELEPKQLIDLKGLMGDKSDNIPGVPGIGEKTGLKLLKEYGSIENIYENIENISGKKLKENLIKNERTAYMSKSLGEIFLSIPLEIEFEELKVTEPDWKELYSLYEQFDFKSLFEKIPDEFREEEIDSLDVKYTIASRDEFQEIIDMINKEGKFAFKFITEDDNYIENRIMGVGIKTKESNIYYIPLEDDKDEFIKSFKAIFEDENIEKIGHDLKKDIVQLYKLEIELDNYSFDTKIAQYVLDPSQNSYDIDIIAREHLGLQINNEENLLGKGKNKKNFKDIDIKEIANFLGPILEVIIKVEPKLKESIEERDMLELLNTIELPLIEVLSNMEIQGFKVDEQELIKLGNEYQEEIDKLIENLYDMAGEEFNINSPKQIGHILFDKLKLPVIKKTKTGYSTDMEVLEKLKDKHPIVEHILRYRQIIKLKSTYIDGLLKLINEKTGRIHTSFHQTIAATGRISSTEPNLQNIPIKDDYGRRIRKAFSVDLPDYVLLDGDYSQIELRILAHISNDENMIEAFKNDEDIHQITASQVFNVAEEDVTPLLRNRAKAVNFGIVYGISDYGLSRDLNISRAEAKNYIDNYLNHYSQIKQYMVDIVKEGKKKGYVETIFRRRRYIPELSAKNFNVRSFGERIAMNTPIQGSAADIIKIAMVRIYNELKKRKLKSKLILQVHDELIIETHKDELEEVEKLMIDTMSDAANLKVNLEVSITKGDNWYDTV